MTYMQKYIILLYIKYDMIKYIEIIIKFQKRKHKHRWDVYVSFAQTLFLFVTKINNHYIDKVEIGWVDHHIGAYVLPPIEKYMKL